MKKIFSLSIFLLVLFSCEKEPKVYVFENPNYKPTDTTSNPTDTTANPTDTTQNPGDTSLEFMCSTADSNALFITGEVVDAEYSKTSDLLVIVTFAPNAILTVDMSSGNIESLALNKEPTSVSVSSQGDEAVVGHDGAASYIQLNQQNLLAFHSIPCNAFDIVLADNGYAYAFPAEGGWTDIVCLQLGTGTITYSTGRNIRDQTKAKLKPGSSFIYGTDNGLSPSDIEKYDVQTGTANYLYNSPYHGDYPISGNLWFSESGSHIITRGRTILNTATGQAQDMTYAGTLTGKGQSVYQDFLYHADHSSQADKLYTIFNNGYYSHQSEAAPDSVIRVYGGTYFGYEGDIIIPFVKENEDCYLTEAYYGFFNSAGTEFYLVMHAISNDNSNKRRWVISSLKV